MWTVAFKNLKFMTQVYPGKLEIGSLSAQINMWTAKGDGNGDDATAPGYDDPYREFFTSPPVSAKEAASVCPKVAQRLRDALNNHTDSLPSQDKNGDEIMTEDELSDPPVADDTDYMSENKARAYQVSLLEKAKQRNIIIHLGTGAGKTLIAVCLIRHCLQQQKSKGKHTTERNKQAVFLVPSVALCVQHTATLEAALAFRVAQVSGDMSQLNDEWREAQVLVATHGAYLELLLHYSDKFCLENVDLLVFDECHNCTGNSPYVQILKEFYHTRPETPRPKILGLTASPLINVKPSHTREQILGELYKLESLMDAEVVSHASQHKTKRSDVAVAFRSCPWPPDLPDPAAYQLHKKRAKEVDQILKLFGDLGGTVTGAYCDDYLCNMTRNKYEEEGEEQFSRAQQLVKDVIRFCKKSSEMQPLGGASPKLVELEKLLGAELSQKNNIGCVFVERRITAVALNRYFAKKSPRSEIEEDQVAEEEMVTEEGLLDEDQKCIEAGQFDDDDDSMNAEQGQLNNIDEGQFDDAEEESLTFPTPDSNQNSIATFASQESSGNKKAFNWMRPCVMIRKKDYMANTAEELSSKEVETVQEQHGMASTSAILRDLCTGKRNVLFATSIVEEGIDIPSCSFVVCFDGVKNLKSYIQMKGRARQQGANFYIFEDLNFPGDIEKVDKFKNAEERVNTIILESRQYHGHGGGGACVPVEEVTVTSGSSVSSLAFEIESAENGYVTAPNGKVTANTARSVLNRYFTSLASDSGLDAASKSNWLAHFPFYDEELQGLVLPGCLKDNNVVTLPNKFADFPTKKKDDCLHLMAVARLFFHNLLNDRLLPCTTTDIEDKLNDLLKCSTLCMETTYHPPTALLENRCFVYRLSIKAIEREDLLIGLNRTPRQLALISSTDELPVPPSQHHFHKDFGRLSYGFEGSNKICISLSENQKTALSEFTAILLNERWSKGGDQESFHLRTTSDITMDYRIACVMIDHDVIDWELVTDVISRHQRATKSDGYLLPQITDFPRIWHSKHNQFQGYIVDSVSTERCSSQFPHPTKTGARSYKDYFLQKYGVCVDPDSTLFRARYLWSNPNSIQQNVPSSAANSTFTVESKAVLLPRDVCIEPVISDVGLSLELTLLPHALYMLERRLNILQFQESCKENFPILSSCLEQCDVEEVGEVISASSCELRGNYEKCEWIGDALLKLLVTDDLIRTALPELKSWVQSSPEGTLTKIRSQRVSNEHLEKVCKSVGFDRFIMTKPMARGKWWPAPFASSATSSSEKYLVTPKQRADVIEAILGRVYASDDSYETAVAVASELHIIYGYSADTAQSTNETDPENFLREDPSDTTDAMERITGTRGFRNPRLVIEAFTHGTALSRSAPSYQRLEWIGDAVLGFAVRDWMYKNVEGVSLGEMDRLAHSIVSNESLAFVSLQTKAHGCLSHGYSNLPHQFRTFLSSTQHQRRGLWNSEPPKVMADIIESAIGAVHEDQGFEKGREAALFAVGPILQLVLDGRQESFRRHPKKCLTDKFRKQVTLGTKREDEFLKIGQGSKVWDGDLWREPNRSDLMDVASISFLNSSILEVADVSPRVAMNQACALVLATLERDAELERRVDETVQVISQAKSKSKD